MLPRNKNGRISRMKKINAVVIGAGNMGQHHARIYTKLPNVELVAICDIDEKRGREIAKKNQALFFNTPEELLNSGLKIDVASIVVPTKLHKKIACLFLKKGINVLVEKPIAHRLTEAQDIIQTAQKYGVKLAVGHIERFNPAVIKLKEIIEEGKLGKIIAIVARRVGPFTPSINDANVFLDFGVHEVEVINYLLNEYPTKISRHSARFHTKFQDDSGELLLYYKEAVCFVQVNWVTPVKIRKLMITGTEGYAELDYISQEVILHKAKIKRRTSTFSEFLSFSKPRITKLNFEKKEPLQSELESFISCVKNNTEPVVSGESAFKTLEVCLGK